MPNRRQRIQELQLQLQVMQNTISLLQSDLDDGNDASDEDYHSEPTHPTTRRMRYSRIQQIRQNPPPTLTFEDNRTLSQNSPPDETGWARAVEDFYFHGDSGGNPPFCHIILFGTVQVPRDFWSFLVGEHSNASLWKMHINGWAKRWLRYRQTQVVRNEVPMKWTIMPTKFDSSFHLPRAADAIKYASGNYKPYPAWADVDHVLVPMLVGENRWILVHINRITPSFSIYSPTRRTIPKEELKDIFLQRWRYVLPAFLVAIYGHSDTPISGFQGYAKKVPQCKVEDSGVFVCRLIHKLVMGNPIDLDEGVTPDQAAMDYRKLMARDLYSYCFTGVGSRLPFRGPQLFDPLD